MDKILITTSSFDAEMNPSLITLRGRGTTIVMNPHGRRMTEPEIQALMDPDVIGIIAGLEPLSAQVIAAAPRLRAISRCGIGLDNVDLKAAAERGITVCNTPEAPSASVAELTVALMLACLRRLTEGDRAVRAGQWPRLSSTLLSARTVGLVGYGRIGHRVGALCQAFGAEVLAYDPLHTADAGSAESVNFDSRLERSDLISLHCPAEPRADALFDAEVIARMRPGGILINTARGSLIDESALHAALKQGHLVAAGLDVFVEEPYCGPLRELEQVVLSPHLGSAARETRQRMEHEAAKNLVDALEPGEASTSE